MSKIWVLALPVLLSNLLQTSVTVVDTFMVGQLGPVPIAAVGMGNTIRMLLLILFLSVSGGAMSLVAQARGGRDKKRMSRITRQSIVSGLMLSGIIMLIGGLSAGPMMEFIDQGDNEEVVALGTIYLQVLFLGAPFLVLNLIVNRLMQGAGDTLTPLMLTAVMVVLNIFFNYIFIFGWGMIPAYGVVGAAYGTLAARGLSTIAAIVIFHSGKNVIHILPGSWWPDWSMIKDILSIGVPSGIQGVFRHSATLMVIFLLTATELGTFGAAALTIGYQVASLATMPVVGLNVASTSLVGRALGKWQIEEANYIGKLMIVLGVLLMLILVTPMIIFAEEIILIFDPSANPAVLKGSLGYFHTNLIFLPVTAASIIITGALRGTGHTTPAMISTLIGRNACTLLFAWLLAFPLEMGSIGVWWGIVIGRLIDVCYMLYTWAAKKWINVALEKSEVYRKHLKELPVQVREKFLEEVRAPQMAIPHTLEVVGEDGVLYQRPDQELEVVFEESSYRKF
ncbi:MAG: MATE family efflux transporter [Bacteroidia bacterium]|nr:MATE family efflux transporter [Bacteroidia bacterium]